MNQPGSFHGKIDPRGIDQREIARLTPSQRQKVQEAIETINDPALLPAGAFEYQQAWRDLLGNLPPKVSLLLMMNSFMRMPVPPKGNSYRDQITTLTEERFAPLLGGASYCFSSRQFDYPKKQGEFWRVSNVINPDNLVRGWEYLPLIDKSLRSNNCSPEDVIAIMNDLLYLGAPHLYELVDLIASEHWDDSPEFARAWLTLALTVPSPDRRSDEEIERGGYRNTEDQVEFAERKKTAALRLIPEKPGTPFSEPGDEEMVMKTIRGCFSTLFKAERDSLFADLKSDPRVTNRPALMAQIQKIYDLNNRQI